MIASVPIPPSKEEGTAIPVSNITPMPQQKSKTPFEGTPPAPYSGLVPLSAASPAPPTVSDSGNDGGFFDFMGLLTGLMKRWWVLAICLVLGLIAAIAYVKTAEPIYVATATLKVEQGQSSLQPLQIRDEDFRSLEVLRTEEARVMSSNMLVRVAHVVGLDSRGTQLPEIGEDESYSDSQLIDALRAKVGANLQRGTRLIVVTVEDPDPERAKEIAAAFVLQAKNFSSENISEQAASAQKGLIAEAKRLSRELANAEENIQAYRDEHNNVPLGEKNDTLESKLRNLSDAVTKARDERLRLGSQIGKSAPADILRVPSVASSAEIVALRQNIDRAKAKFARVREQKGASHPAYIAAQSELTELQGSLENAALQAAASIRRGYEAALETETRLETAIDEQRQQLLARAALSTEYERLVRERKALQGLHDKVNVNLRRTQVDPKVLGVSNITSFADPVVPDYPWFPRKKLCLVLGGFAGGSAGLGLALLLALMDQKVRGPRQIERIIGMPALASMPEDPQGRVDRVLRTSAEPRTLSSEAIRTLGAGLESIARQTEGEATSVLFTSARPNEGTSFCAAHFAAFLARQGYRTLLVDANLRRPAQEKQLVGQTSGFGLANYLDRTTETVQGCRETAVPRLFLLPAGESERNPGELLARGELLGTVIGDAGRRFDRVVIDAPEAGVLSDAIRLSHHAQSVCLVVHADKTKRSDVENTARRLRMAGANLVGFVLNRTEDGSDSR